MVSISFDIRPNAEGTRRSWFPARTSMKLSFTRKNYIPITPPPGLVYLAQLLARSSCKMPKRPQLCTARHINCQFVGHLGQVGGRVPTWLVLLIVLALPLSQLFSFLIFCNSFPALTGVLCVFYLKVEVFYLALYFFTCNWPR